MKSAVIYIDSHWRSLIKGFSWRISGTLVSILVSYLFTGKWDIALKIGALEFVSKIFLFYGHEQIWHCLPWGLKQKSITHKNSRILSETESNQ